MPAAGPSYPAGPYRFINREFLVITYETDAALIRAGLPEPLEPIDQSIVHYEWIKMPDSSGFGSYTECGLVIPARLHGHGDKHREERAAIARTREVADHEDDRMTRDLQRRINLDPSLARQLDACRLPDGGGANSGGPDDRRCSHLLAALEAK